LDTLHTYIAAELLGNYKHMRKRKIWQWDDRNWNGTPHLETWEETLCYGQCKKEQNLHTISVLCVKLLFSHSLLRYQEINCFLLINLHFTFK
jgi:hypothetical protein